MGSAIAHLHIQPTVFWRMSVAEYWAAFVSLVPKESINTNIEPFSDEEKVRLKELEDR